MVDAKSYGWENRVKFIVKFMYDIDNNGRDSLFLSFLFYFFYHWGNIREKNDGSELIENYLYFYSLDKNDFECLAVRNTVIEGKGAWDEAKYKENSEIMAKLWNEIADLADFEEAYFPETKFPNSRDWVQWFQESGHWRITIIQEWNKE